MIRKVRKCNQQNGAVYTATGNTVRSCISNGLSGVDKSKCLCSMPSFSGFIDDRREKRLDSIFAATATVFATRSTWELAISQWPLESLFRPHWRHAFRISHHCTCYNRDACCVCSTPGIAIGMLSSSCSVHTQCDSIKWQSSSSDNRTRYKTQSM